MWHPEVVNFIVEMRKKHPRLGKEKLKPFVDKFCEEKGLRTISVSTIGRIIRHPEGNGYVERFNRTLEEEYIEYMREELREDIEWFNRSLMRYMIWYNVERVHSGLKYKTPLGYFCEKFLKNNTQSEIIWTHT